MLTAGILVALAHGQQSGIGEEFSYILMQRCLISLQRRLK